MHFDIPQPLAPHSASPTHHMYGTRTRKPSLLKPGARLHQSTPPPPPRRIKPVPSSPTHKLHLHHEDSPFPVFPLPNVMLHTEDASNKVLHAIGRAFLSVDNHAMTVKDLAEMTLKFGLMCQNVSAASQAITTYIRNHLSRCEAQQDHPLLLRHVLSGTPADDELVPALYSRVGGAASPNKTSTKDSPAAEKKTVQSISASHVERLTNFRRGTMVWYLSKAAGVPCPFARAGIRLCEYGKEGKRSPDTIMDDSLLPNKHKHAQVRCGEKRKRLRRGCRETSEDLRQRPSVEPNSSAAVVDSGYGGFSDSSESDDEGEERPPKVKLTLRLRPSGSATMPPSEVIDLSKESSSSAEVSDGDTEMHLASPDVPWSLPPYPRRSITLPLYTPSCSDPHQFLARASRRSPSVPCSASPPPDSDHDELDLELSADSDFDWDVSSLSNPSPAIPAATMRESHSGIKDELRDVRDMLDLWENLDCAPANPSTVSSATVKLPADDIRLEEHEFWEWEFENSWCGAVHLQDTDFKDKVGAPENLPSALSLRTLPPDPAFPEAPCSPFTPSSSSLNSSSSSSPGGVVGVLGSFTFRSSSPLTPSSLLSSTYSPPASASSSLGQDNPLTWQDTELLGPDSVHPEEFEEGWSDNCKLQHLGSLRVSSPLSIKKFPSTPSNGRPQIQMSAEARRQAEAKAIATTDARPPSHGTTSNVVIVHTCKPCVPAITATQVEAISVYQTTLGLTPLLRRIDTDFVNLSTILSYLSLPSPSPLPQACVNIIHRLPFVTGIWAPLSIAGTYAERLPGGVGNIFLSDELVMHFPTALQDFHQKSTPGRILNQFGPHFRSSVPIDLPLVSSVSEPNAAEGVGCEAIIDEDEALEAVLEETLVTISSSFDFELAGLRPCMHTEDVATLPETPLTPSEQEMFHTLCKNVDWEEDKEVEVVDTEVVDCTPLRRSRRVADAVVARTRARLNGPRHS